MNISLNRNLWKRTSRVKRRIQQLLYAVLFLGGFIYFNIQYNWPVMHVFRNRNTQLPCILPKFDLYDKQIARFFWPQTPLKCETWLNIVYIDSDGVLHVNDSAVKEEGFGHVQCRYGKVTRLTGDYKIKIQPKVLLENPVYIDSDFIHVECHDKSGKRVYNNLHMHIDRKAYQERKDLHEETTNQLSVLMFGIDSVSRLIAERKLPKTMKYIREELGAYVFKGYTKVGDNSYPNLLPVLTGFKAYKEEPAGLDNIPFIWQNFSRKGYVDMLAEDHPTLATFQGFREAPVTHYLRPYFLSMETISPRSALNNAYMFVQHRNILQNTISPMCFGNKLKHTYVIDYTKHFIDTYKFKQKFAYTWMTEITHDFLNILELADEEIRAHFKWLKDSRHLENSVLIFYGDHGPRYNEIQNTAVGRISNLLPLLSIVIPNHLKTRFPHIHENLQINTKRLATSYDLFETMKDILNADFDIKSAINDREVPRGISLFREIPKSRSCRDSDISEHYCPCYSSQQLTSEDERVQEIATFIVDKINKILEDIPNRCAKLTLDSVQQASLVYADMVRDASEERYFSFRSFLWQIKDATRILISLTTSPGGARFETTVEYRSKTDIKILGDINRTNKYGSQAKCIKFEEKFYRLYCLCL